MPIQTQHKKGVLKENHVCSDLCDLWSSRIFSSISLLWLGAKVCWLMKSRGRGWSGSWSPNSACEAFTQYLVNKIQPRTQHEKNKKHQYTKYINDWMHTVQISRFKAVPAACMSPAEHEWQMNKADVRMLRRREAADTRGTWRETGTISMEQ